MRFNSLLNLIGFSGKAHGGPPVSGCVTNTRMPDSPAPSQALFRADFRRYIPLSGGRRGNPAPGTRHPRYCRGAGIVWPGGYQQLVGGIAMGLKPNKVHQCRESAEGTEGQWSRDGRGLLRAPCSPRGRHSDQRVQGLGPGRPDTRHLLHILSPGHLIGGRRRGHAMKGTGVLNCLGQGATLS